MFLLVFLDTLIELLNIYLFEQSVLLSGVAENAIGS